MTYRDFIRDARIELFAFLFGIVCWLKFSIDAIRDRLNGDVDHVLGGFDKLQGRLERATTAAKKKAARSFAAADRLYDQYEAAEATGESFTADAERAGRVQQRIAKLLD